MGPNSQLRDPFAYGRRSATFSAWAMAIVFAAVAIVSFAIDQTVTLSPSTAARQGEVDPPSVWHPVQLIHSLIDAALH
jgi:hypothetical protein